MRETLPFPPVEAYVYNEGSQGFKDLNSIEVTPRSQQFQTQEIWDGFDMVDTVVRLHEAYRLAAEQSLYMVVFRSHRQAGLGQDQIDLLTAFDDMAHHEANDRLDDNGKQSLLHYFKGMPDTDGNCMSWCIWTDAALAQQAVHAPEHMKAARLARTSYDSYKLQKYNLSLTEQGLRIKSAQDSTGETDVWLAYPE